MRGTEPEPQPGRLSGHASRVARIVVSAPIVAYQRVISPGLPRRCRYEPTCSRYAVQALAEYGILRGLVLAAWRLLRCNPWSRGGYDPVEAQQLFRVAPAPQARR
ncbi:MAG TPA: membrane protein insertion efficiency factor YidD [Solirubrobacteraceae bacterium]|nr:membrane protein insertion efficiency factor YidD [Solirubrobacteraceae bacterium]